jgi:hypothetical protein
VGSKVPQVAGRAYEGAKSLLGRLLREDPARSQATSAIGGDIPGGAGGALPRPTSAASSSDSIPLAAAIARGARPTLAAELRSPNPLPALSAPSNQSASGTPNVLIRTTDSRGIVQHRNLEGKYASAPEKGTKTKVVRKGTAEEADPEKPGVQIDDTKPLRYED